MRSLQEGKKTEFLAKNFIKGIFVFGAIILVFVLTGRYVQNNFMPYLEALYANSFLFYGIFTASEILFGILPLELFMIVYILNNLSLSQFIMNLAGLTLISYGAGTLNYFIGRNFANTAVVERITEKFLKRYKAHLKLYGKYLLFASAITPIPFSAVCLLTGLVRLPASSFLIISTARILRFAAYGWALWNVTEIFL